MANYTKLIFIILLFAFVNCASADTPDDSQSQLVYDTIEGLGVDEVAQKFYINHGDVHTIDAFYMYLKKIGSPTGNLVVRLRDDDGAAGAPGTILATWDIATSSISTTLTEYNVMGSVYAVTDYAAGYYYISIDGQTAWDESNHIQYRDTLYSAYSSGEEWTLVGGVWQYVWSGEYDFYFRLIYSYDAYKPAPPSMTYPTNGQTGIELNPTFTWGASSDPDGDTPVRYYLSLDHGYGAVCSGTQSTSCAITGLSPATTYTISKHSLDSYLYDHGGGYASDTSTFTTISNTPNITSWGNNYTNDTTLNFSVSNLTAVRFNVTSDQIVSYSWTIYDGFYLRGGQSGTQNYYEYQFDNKSNWTVTVFGNNSNGTTTNLTWNINVTDIIVNPITNLTVTAFDDDSVSLSWLNPTDASYNLTQIFKNGAWAINTTDQNITFGSLNSNTNYTFSFRTMSDSGEFSIWVNITQRTAYECQANEKCQLTVNTISGITIGYIGEVVTLTSSTPGYNITQVDYVQMPISNRGNYDVYFDIFDFTGDVRGSLIYESVIDSSDILHCGWPCNQVRWTFVLTEPVQINDSQKYLFVMKGTGLESATYVGFSSTNTYPVWDFFLENATGEYVNGSRDAAFIIGYTETLEPPIVYDRYVQKSGSDSNNGQSWANAYRYISTGVNNTIDDYTVHFAFGNYSNDPPFNFSRFVYYFCSPNGTAENASDHSCTLPPPE